MVMARGGNAKSKYIRKAKIKKAEAKRSTQKDMGQDFQIQKLAKTVRGLTQSVKGWINMQNNNAAGGYLAVPTIVGVASTASMLAHVQLYLTPIAQSDLQGGRQGDYITVTRIQLRYDARTSVMGVTTTNGLTSAVRVLVVCFNRPNGVPGVANASLVPTFEDLLSVQAAAMTRTNLRQSFNPEQRTNAHVYYDRIHVLASQQLTTQGFSQHASGQITIVPKKKNRTVKYNDVNNGIQMCEENMFVLFVLSDNADAADANPLEFQVNGLCEFQQ